MPTLAFLELLGREASLGEFETPVTDARSRGDHPEAIARLEHARTLALHVRGMLDQRRRREAELSGLYETANDLAVLHEVDDVLTAIVHRARLLLSSDVAYISLNDDTAGETYMRVVDGITSAAFRRLRLPMGKGLGGLVAQTATPYAAARYIEDKRFHQTSMINDAVVEEGLVSILGVPLLLGTTVIGVLYAANRSERPFDRAHVSLLVTLALHAAIALEKARLLSETNAALEDLSVASSLLREHTFGVERASNTHDRLTRLVLRGGDVKDVAAAVSEVLNGTLWLVDVAARPIASTAGPSDVLSIDIPAITEAAQESGRAVQRDGWWAVCAMAGHELLGTLLLHSENELNEWDVRTFERAALVTALLLLLRRSVTETESRVKGELLNDILDGSLRDLDSLRERARRVSADLDARQTVVVLRSASSDKVRLVAAASLLAGQLRGLATEWRGAVVLLVPADDPGDVARQICAELALALSAPVTAGASAPLERPEQVPAAWREASRCLEALEALGRGGEGASAAELGFLGVLLVDRLDVMPFVRRTIGPLLDYDEEHGTELVDTLEAYFGADRNLLRTHEALQIHVHTVTQRLERVTKLLDEGWQRHDRCLEVHIALRLYRISRPAPDAAALAPAATGLRTTLR